MSGNSPLDQSLDRNPNDAQNRDQDLDRSTNLDVTGAMPGQESKSSLSVPPQPGRKRGLSLRSQLFNKAFAGTFAVSSTTNGSSTTGTSPSDDLPQAPRTQTAEPESHPNSNSDFELQNMPTPLIKVEEAPNEGTNANGLNGDAPRVEYNPYNPINRVPSANSDNEPYNGSVLDFAYFLPNGGKSNTSKRSGFLKSVIKLKNKVLGNRNLPPTESGRKIPVAINHTQVNSELNGDYYDPYTKQLIDERSNDPYCNNIVTLSKYTIYNFIPKQLKAQFSKVANCYFMIVAILQMIPTWSTTGQYTTIIPLLIFMSISIAREAFDDWKRHVHDKEENNKICTVIREDQDFSNVDSQSIRTIVTETMNVNGESTAMDRLGIHNIDNQDSPEKRKKALSYRNRSLMKSYNIKEYKTKWKRLKVGDIVKIHEDEWLPADVLLLATSNDSQEAYVETMALDGETNLKLKNPHVELSKTYSTALGLSAGRTLITVEDPNLDLYNFEGHFKVGVENNVVDNKTYALGPDNVIYRGSILRNTKSALGLVIFTGEETKIRMNNIKNPRVKSPKLQKNINYIVLFMVCVVILLSAFSTMGERLLYMEDRSKNWYLMDQDAGIAATLMGFIIMYNTLIPLSLYVTMEIIKVMQLVFLQNDIDMYHVESNTPADAKTATILEELGQVGYVFSDKTGTLTDNLMLFRKFSVCGVSWIHDLDVLQEDKKKQSDNEAWSRSSSPIAPVRSTTEAARKSMDVKKLQKATSWKSTAHPGRSQDLVRSMELLRYVQSHPQTLFSKKAKFFLLSIALCNTCLPKKHKDDLDDIGDENFSSANSSELSLKLDELTKDDEIDYQAASPDELALVEAARDLGFVVFDRKNKILKIKTYPNGFDGDYKVEEYEILDVIEFSSGRKRMSIILKFPDGRICLLCKGADNVILERLKNRDMAMNLAKKINQNSSDRKVMEADAILHTRMSQDLEGGSGIEDSGNGNGSPRNSLSSLRRSLSIGRNSTDPVERLNSIDNYLMSKEDEQLDDIALRSRNSLKQIQRQKYNLNAIKDKIRDFVPSDKLLVNEEYLLEKTLEHVEEFSTEGLRTLLYSFKWLDKSTYENWSQQYGEAKTALTNRSTKVDEVGSLIEDGFELLGATAIEDKLQDGVSETIDKLRRAGIKMWMLTGDKRETAINIGYSCRLIKDYSTVVILSQEEGREGLMQRITSASAEIRAGRVAHSVVVIDGATLADFENDITLMSVFVEFCVEVDSAIVCRASPSQKESMVSHVRKLKKDCVTLAIGDGANDIAMIQSADIGVGITGKEGLQAARSSDYSIAQFRFLLKLLLVNGRYNYIRTSKFVLCTFYKELLFYLTQAVYQRFTLFSGSSMYEPWSLSMFNTLFTSLCVLCVGMFDRDLKPATLIAIPELYSKGRLYQAFNLKLFIAWVTLATAQSMFLSFTSNVLWSDTALRDNTTLPIGTMLYAAMVIIINVKCEIIEMQNRQWLAFAALIISVGGYGLWNVLIMYLYRSKQPTIFYVDYGLMMWGADISWWASLLLLATIPILFDVLLKVFQFMFKPSDDELFKFIEKDIGMRRLFEEHSWSELHQGWTMEREPLTVRMKILTLLNRFGVVKKNTLEDVKSKSDYQRSVVQRKRAGTLQGPTELTAGSDGVAIYQLDADYLPSGKSAHKSSWWRGKNKDEEIDIDSLLERRLGRARSISGANV